MIKLAQGTMGLLIIWDGIESEYLARQQIASCIIDTVRQLLSYA